MIASVAMRRLLVDYARARKARSAAGSSYGWTWNSATLSEEAHFADSWRSTIS